MTNEELANELLKEWVLLPPTGCVVRVKRSYDEEPLEFQIDDIEIEIELSFTLWQRGESEDAEFESCSPEDIIEFISIPEEWYAPNLWWRCPRRGET